MPTKQITKPQIYTTQLPAPASAVDKTLEFLLKRISQHETLGALLDTAAVMDPVPSYLQTAISDVETEIAALEAVTA